MATGDRIRIGTSGFSFKDWKGPFYPEGLGRDKLLEFYAKYFDVVEINATYYRIPEAKTFADMVRRTDGDFGFVVKLHQTMTHGREGDRRPFEDFFRALKPLEVSGRLIALLAQFPGSFACSEDNISYLKWLRLKLETYSLFVEFRHASWLRDETYELLREICAGWCNVDEPLLEGLLPPTAEATTPAAYVRFHGRNDIDWRGPRPGSDRYLYDYSERELREWIPRIDSLAARCVPTLLFFNNCHFGNAPKNARTMKQLLGITDIRPHIEGELRM